MMLTQLLRALGYARSGRLVPTDLPRRPATPRPIVVGIDGSSASIRALKWAWVRAWAGDSPLQVVHVLRVQNWLDPHTQAFWDIGARAAGQKVLDDAARWVSHPHPAVKVTFTLRMGDPVSAILRLAKGAELIVLGDDDGLGPRTTSPWHRSLTAQVARRARGRLVIVGVDHETAL